MAKVTVSFNILPTFTEATVPNGVTVKNTTTLEIAPITSALKITGGELGEFIEYGLTWLVAPLAGETLECTYDGLGDYTNSDGSPMAPFTIPIYNCADGIPSDAGFGPGFGPGFD